MSHRLIAAVLMTVLACGQKGVPGNVNPDEPAPQPSATPKPVDPALNPTSVKLRMVKGVVNEDQQCAGVHPGLVLSDRPVAGRFPEWTPAMTVMSRGDSGAGWIRSLSLNFDESRSLFGQLELQIGSDIPNDLRIRIHLGVVDFTGGQISVLNKRQLLIEDGVIYWLEQSGEQTIIADAYTEWTGSQLHFAIPAPLVEGVVLYPYWHVEVFGESSLTAPERTGARIIRSPRTANSEFELSECRPMKDGESHPVLSLIHPKPIDSNQVRQLLGVTRFAWISTRAAVQSRFGGIVSWPMLMGNDLALGEAVATWPQRVASGAVLYGLVKDYSAADRTTPRWRQYEMFQRLSEQFTLLHLLAGDSQEGIGTIPFGTALGYALAKQVCRQVIGFEYSIFEPRPTTPFALRSDVSGERINLEAYDWTAMSLDARALGKLFSFGEMLGGRLDSPALIRIWNSYRSLSSADRNLQYAKRLVQFEFRNAVIDESYVEGWIGVAEYHADNGPMELLDADGDSINGFLERQLGLSPFLADSDLDGWSDLAELTSGFDPTLPNDRPDNLHADGLFEDWRQLLPNRVQVDKDPVNSACNGSGDISHFAAIFDRDQLMVMGHTAASSAQPQHHWKAFVEINMVDGSKQLTFDQRPGQRDWEAVDMTAKQKYQFQSATLINSRTMEAQISLRDILTQSEAEKVQDIRFRIQTVLNGSDVCDDTPWSLALNSRE